MSQGFDSKVLSESHVKVLLLTSLLFGLVCVNTLSARLASTLAIKEQTSTVKSLQDVKEMAKELYIEAGKRV